MPIRGPAGGFIRPGQMVSVRYLKAKEHGGHRGQLEDGSGWIDVDRKKLNPVSLEGIGEELKSFEVTAGFGIPLLSRPTHDAM